ncbi:hypothetical protein J2X66_001312 [Pseudomonas sp. 3296]|jgi:hypothetical protein|nr:hypothetical protein [Pseudomonas sp. 3296]
MAPATWCFTITASSRPRTRQHFHQVSRHWLPSVPPAGLDIVIWSVPTQSRTRDTQAEKQVYAAISSERQVRGELSPGVSADHARAGGACQGGVQSGSGYTAVALPTELQPIAAKLQAYALREPFPPQISVRLDGLQVNGDPCRSLQIVERLSQEDNYCARSRSPGMLRFENGLMLARGSSI